MLELFNLDLEQFGAGLDAVPESAEKSPLPVERAEKQTVRDVVQLGKCSNAEGIRGKIQRKIAANITVCGDMVETDGIEPLTF